jgi:serine/threonine protein kinase
MIASSSPVRAEHHHSVSDSALAIVRLTLQEKGLELQDFVASGGFSSVYIVRRIGTQQIFALKISDVEHTGGWQGEVASLMKLYHSNIIQLYQIFHDAKFTYLVLEYCTGGTLADRVARSGPLGTREFRDIAKQLLDALGKCHEEGIAHLDIKPTNILFTSDGRVRLSDFGCSQGIALDDLFSGSKPYMAPEIICKMQGYDIFMADIWSLGVTFYFMATARLPWKSSSSEGIAGEIRLGSIIPISGVDPAVAALIDKMLILEPSLRAPCPRLLAHMDTWINGPAGAALPMRRLVKHASMIAGRRLLSPSSSSNRILLVKSFLEPTNDLGKTGSSNLTSGSADSDAEKEETND